VYVCVSMCVCLYLCVSMCTCMFSVTANGHYQNPRLARYMYVNFLRTNESKRSNDSAKRRRSALPWCSRAAGTVGLVVQGRFACICVCVCVCVCMVSLLMSKSVRCPVSIHQCVCMCVFVCVLCCYLYQNPRATCCVSI